jgi:hypothetical protein
MTKGCHSGYQQSVIPATSKASFRPPTNRHSSYQQSVIPAYEPESIAMLTPLSLDSG